MLEKLNNLLRFRTPSGIILRAMILASYREACNIVDCYTCNNLKFNLKQQNIIIINTAVRVGYLLLKKNS